jgi:Domain of unknown function (DUF5667)
MLHPSEDKFDDHLEELFNKMRTVSPLDPQVVAEERAKFLAQGEQLRAAGAHSSGSKQLGWFGSLALAFRKNQPMSVWSALIAAVITVAVVFGGASATVYAAQGSLPDQALYPVKTWSEDTHLALVGSAQEQLNLTLDYTDRRVSEIAKLLEMGKPLDDQVEQRYANELQAALQIAAGMDDAPMAQALVQIRQRAEIQEQVMQRVMLAESGAGDPRLVRLQARIQEQVRLAAFGESDPQGFRLQIHERYQGHQGIGWVTATPTGSITPTATETPLPTGNGYGPGLRFGQGTSTPGQYGPGDPTPSQTPKPTDGYGPGPGTGKPTATSDGYGPGPKGGTATQSPTPKGDGEGPGPNPTQTPTPKGPGPNPTQTPTPQGPSGQNPSATPQGGTPGQGRGSPTP